MDFAKKSHEVFLYLLSPSLSGRQLIHQHLETDAGPDVKYSFSHWISHLKKSEVDEFLWSTLHEFVVDPDVVCLFVKDNEDAANTFLDIILSQSAQEVSFYFIML